MSELFAAGASALPLAARMAPRSLDEFDPALTTIVHSGEEGPVAFLEESLKKSVRQYRAYWKRHLFSIVRNGPGEPGTPLTFTVSAVASRATRLRNVSLIA